jgi:hypothetical protein
MCSSLQCSSDTAVRNFYDHRIAPVEKYLPTYDEVLSRICTQPRYATILSSYFITSLQGSRRLKCKLTGVSQASITEHLSMPIAKGSPYIRIMNYKYVPWSKLLQCFLQYYFSLLRIHVNDFFFNHEANDLLTFRWMMMMMMMITVMNCTSILFWMPLWPWPLVPSYLYGVRWTELPFRCQNIKVNVKLSLCLTKHHAMKAYWGRGGIVPLILWRRH